MSRQNITPVPRHTLVQAAAISEQIPRVGNLSTVPNFRLACRNCAEEGHLSQEWRNHRVFFSWDCGRRGMQTVFYRRRTRPGNERSLSHLGDIYYRSKPAELSRRYELTVGDSTQL